MKTVDLFWQLLTTNRNPKKMKKQLNFKKLFKSLAFVSVCTIIVIMLHSCNDTNPTKDTVPAKDSTTVKDSLAKPMADSSKTDTTRQVNPNNPQKP